MNIPLSDKQKIKILNADDLFGIMVKILEREEKIDKDKEHLWVHQHQLKNEQRKRKSLKSNISKLSDFRKFRKSNKN